MYQAIETKFLPWTNTKPSRIKAVTCSGVSLTFSKSELMDATGNVRDEDAHREAARRLAVKMDWQGSWFGGATKNGYAWVTSPASYGTFTVTPKGGE